MKRAFSLIETIFALFVFGIIFSFFYLSYLQYSKNSSFSHLIQRIYIEEKELEEGTNFLRKNIQLEVKDLNFLPFVEFESSVLRLKSLKPTDESYKVYFKDEKSF